MSITAMKQALEALEMLAKWEHPASNITTKTGRIYPQRIAADAADALCAAIAEAEKQEPVAWANINKYGDITHISNKKMPWAKTPIYTTPPAAQRQWVGLTEAEINEWDYDTRDVVMDIEKLLREKNA
jgi:pyruvate/2-oxoglutarate dehydrogenase complex dihydrolipoamide dehydrogenase (E3) component